MRPTGILRHFVKGERKRGAQWVRAFDKTRLLFSADGRSVLLTSIVHSRDVHQTTTYTEENRYPTLFDYAARIAPEARRILSFGCATGEEISSLRTRFPTAEIVGVEVNPRCRRTAARRLADDSLSRVVSTMPRSERFDLILAFAVLQREPHRMLETDTRDLRSFYPFDRFDRAVADLTGLLNPAGILLVEHSQYRVEDSSSSAVLQPIAGSPQASGPFFRPDGRRYSEATAVTAFRKAIGKARNGSAAAR